MYYCVIPELRLVEHGFGSDRPLACSLGRFVKNVFIHIHRFQTAPPNLWPVRELGNVKPARSSGPPYFKLELAIAIDHLEIGAIGGDQAGGVRSSRERDEHIEMQVAKSLGGKPFVRTHLPQQLSRLQPIPCRRGKDGMIPLQCPQKFPLRRLSGATPQLRQHYRRCPDEPAGRFDPFPVAPGPQIVNKDCCVKDDEVTHRTPRTRAFPCAFSLSP